MSSITVMVLAVLAMGFSPRDSCLAELRVDEISAQAIAFCRLAATDDPESSIRLGELLELSGRFAEAVTQYSLLAATADELELAAWLVDRARGSAPMDTLVSIEATLINTGGSALENVVAVLPAPCSHPPYQELLMIGGSFSREGRFLVLRKDRLAAGDTLFARIVLRVRQQPWSFRPLPLPEELPWREMMSRVSLLPSPPDSALMGTGPCLDLAMNARREGGDMNLEIGVVGGILVRGDTLLFHAWNTIGHGGLDIPFDSSLLPDDSIRAIGHASSDLIPLWDLLSTDGHELSVYFSDTGNAEDLSAGLEARFTDAGRLLSEMTDLLPPPLRLCRLRRAVVEEAQRGDPAP